jgi:nucleoside 2-deoxyribosyltransferase
MRIYLIGSLRNPEVPAVAKELRSAGFEVFDDWFAAGPHADDAWRDYEKARGHRLKEALVGYAARHVFDFDKYHLDRADVVVMLLPAGKSGHMELGYALGRGKPGIIQLDSDPERYDVMYRFATAVTLDTQDTLRTLRGFAMREEFRKGKES